MWKPGFLPMRNRMFPARSYEAELRMQCMQQHMEAVRIELRAVDLFWFGCGQKVASYRDGTACQSAIMLT